MCTFRSYIVTKTEVLGLDRSDSHTDILEHFNISDTDLLPNFVRVEINRPNEGADPLDLSLWFFRVDQDYVPDWAKDTASIRGRVIERLGRDVRSLTFQHILSNTPLLGAEHDVNDRQYVARHLCNYDGPRIDKDLEPNCYVRQTLIRATDPSKLRLLTVQEEPDRDLRETVLSNMELASVDRTLTAKEEPCTSLRHSICEQIYYSKVTRLSTWAEEPDPYCQFVQILCMRNDLKLPEKVWTRDNADGQSVQMQVYLKKAYEDMLRADEYVTDLSMSLISYELAYSFLEQTLHTWSRWSAIKRIICAGSKSVSGRMDKAMRALIKEVVKLNPTIRKIPIVHTH